VARTAILVSQIPGHTSAEVVFIPLDFAVCLFAGFVFRRRILRAVLVEMLWEHRL
jgi:hypothetical protein